MTTNNPHSRAHIELKSQMDVVEFIQKLIRFKDNFSIENKNATTRINAKSILGVILAMYEHAGEMYLVNDSNDGFIPSFVDHYRVL